MNGSSNISLNVSFGPIADDLIQLDTESVRILMISYILAEEKCGGLLGPVDCLNLKGSDNTTPPVQSDGS